MKKIKLKKVNKDKFYNFKNKCLNYYLTNKLIIMFIVLAMLGFGLARDKTIGGFFTMRSFFIDLSIILILSGFSYFMKNKNRFKYFNTLLIIFAVMEFINIIYYRFYT